MESYSERFWDNLESLMREKGKSWRSLARWLDMSDPQIFSAKTNRYVPRAERLVMIAKFLSITTDRLLDV